MSDEPTVERKKRKKTATQETEAQEEAAAAPPAPGGGSQGAMMAVAALFVGVAVGWGVRGASTKPAVSAEATAAAAASASAGAMGAATVCEGWASEVCKRTGATSEGCTQARGAAELLSDAACTAAKGDIERTVAKLKSARSSCDTLVEKICADLGDKTDTCKMVREKTPSFPAERCKDMLDHFKEVITELRSAEQERAPLPADLAQRQAAGDGPGFGPKDAKVTLVAYSDFECPFCGRAAEAIGKVKEKYGTKVRFVFRQFPLQMHRNAELAAQASLAAHAQGKFWPFHDLLFQNQRDLERASLEKFAQKAGLDMVKFKKALDDQTYAAVVKSDMQLGTEAHVSGTPSMFLGTARVENAIDFDALSREIDQKLAALD